MWGYILQLVMFVCVQHRLFESVSEACSPILASVDMASRLQVAFDSLGAVYTVLNKHSARQPTEQYSASGQVEIHVEVAEVLVPEIQQDMLNATSGAVDPKVV